MLWTAYGLAYPELRTGALVARRVVDPPLERTLFWARTDRRLSAANEVALAAFLNSVRLRLFDLLGPLATSIEAGNYPVEPVDNDGQA